VVITKWIAVAVATVSVLGLAACSSSAKSATRSESTSTSTPTSGAPNSGITQTGAARITKFVVPADVQCGASTKTTVSVEYAVTTAKVQQIFVDGLELDGVDKPSGTIDAPVHCDGVPHTVALVALDSKGARTSQVKLVNTLLPKN
jgi:ABC-type Fe3+-hydroxamate transport system substrate-binding protein